MKSLSTLLYGLFICAIIADAQSFKVNSPDGKILIQVTTGTDIKWSLSYNGDMILQPSGIALEFASGKTLGNKTNSANHSANTVLQP